MLPSSCPVSSPGCTGSGWSSGSGGASRRAFTASTRTATARVLRSSLSPERLGIPGEQLDVNVLIGQSHLIVLPVTAQICDQEHGRSDQPVIERTSRDATIPAHVRSLLPKSGRLDMVDSPFCLGRRLVATTARFPTADNMRRRACSMVGPGEYRWPGSAAGSMTITPAAPTSRVSVAAEMRTSPSGGSPSERDPHRPRQGRAIMHRDRELRSHWVSSSVRKRAYTGLCEIDEDGASSS